MNFKKIGAFFLLTILGFLTCTLTPAAAGGVLYVCDAGNDQNTGGSVSTALKTLNAALIRLGEEGGTIVVCGPLTLAADAELSSSAGKTTVTSVYGGVDYADQNGARIIFAGNVYLSSELVFENLKLYFQKNTPMVFCQGNSVTFGAGLTCSYISAAPAIWGGTYCGRSGVTAASAMYYDYTIRIDSGTWYYVRGGSLRDGEEQPVGTIGNVALEINGGTFRSSSTSASGNGVIAVTGFDALDGDAALRISDGNFLCAVVGIGRPGYNATSSNNYYGNGNLSITITGGMFTGGRVSAVQDAVASWIDGDFNLTVTGGTFSSTFAGFDADGVRGNAVPNIAYAYYEQGLAVRGFDPVLFVRADGNDSADGLSAATAKKTLSAQSGVIVLCGDASSAGSALSAANGKTLRITDTWNGTDYNSTLTVDGALTADGALTIDGVSFSGSGTISACGDLTIGAGVTGGSGITLASFGGGTRKITVGSGSFAGVAGGEAETGETVFVVIDGGSVGEIVAAEGGSAAVIVRSGQVSGDIYAFASHGDSGAVSLLGGTVESQKIAAAKTPSGRSVDVFGVTAAEGLLDPDTLLDYTAAEKRYAPDEAVFVAGGGTGDGSSPLSPLGDLKAAIEASGGKTIVICGPLTLSDALTLPAIDAKTTITSFHMGIDYRALSDAYLELWDGLRLSEETVLYGLHIVAATNSAYISAEGNPLTIGEDMQCSLFPDKRVEKYPAIVGGSRTLRKILSADTKIVIKSGTWGVVSGGAYTSSPAGFRLTGSTDIRIAGGRITGGIYISGQNHLMGDASLTITGGVIDCSIYGLPDAAVIQNGNISAAVLGGALRGDVLLAQSGQPTLLGTFTLNLQSGDFSRIGQVKGSGSAGTPQSTLNLGADVNTEAELTGTVTYQNPIAGYADPSVVYADGWYYYTFAKSYQSKPAIWMAKAANLCDIGKVEPILVWGQANSTEAQEVTALWAPQLYHLDGKWYVYAAAQTGVDAETGANYRLPYVWEGQPDDPTGSYTLLGCMQNVDTDVYSYLSQHLIEHGGKLYMFCSGFYTAADISPTHIQRLRVCEMSNPYTMASKQILLSSPQYDYEKNIMEGPYPFYGPDGTLWLIFAAGHTRTDEYCTGLMRFNGTESDSLLDASLWEKFSEPFQFVDYESGVYSPGAMVMTVSPDNQDMIAVYHAKTYHYSAYTMRRMYMQRVTFENGMPKIDAPKPVDTEFEIVLNSMPLSRRISGFTSTGTANSPAPASLSREVPIVSNRTPGDVNGDGRTSLADVFRTLRYLSGSLPSGFDLVHADLDGDGQVLAQDVLLILRATLRRS